MIEVIATLVGILIILFFGILAVAGIAMLVGLFVGVPLAALIRFLQK